MIWKYPTAHIEVYMTDKLKSGMEVLGRDTKDSKWRYDVFAYYDEDESYPFCCLRDCHKFCIPLKGNEHLMDTTIDDQIVFWDKVVCWDSVDPNHRVKGFYLKKTSSGNHSILSAYGMGVWECCEKSEWKAN